VDMCTIYIQANTQEIILRTILFSWVLRERTIYEQDCVVVLNYITLLDFRVIPCQVIQSYISDRNQNTWNFISREISSFWFQNTLNFF